MKEKIDAFKKRVIVFLRARFNKYTFRIEKFSEEDSSTIRVGAFNVPENQVYETEDFIYDLLEEDSFNNNYSLLVFVRNIETTKKYYPEQVWTSAPQLPGTAITSKDSSTCCSKITTGSKQQEWHGRLSSVPTISNKNKNKEPSDQLTDEFALAA